MISNINSPFVHTCCPHKFNQKKGANRTKYEFGSNF